jgi:hypothetical protein
VVAGDAGAQVLLPAQHRRSPSQRRWSHPPGCVHLAALTPSWQPPHTNSQTRAPENNNLPHHSHHCSTRARQRARLRRLVRRTHHTMKRNPHSGFGRAGRAMTLRRYARTRLEYVREPLVASYWCTGSGSYQVGAPRMPWNHGTRTRPLVLYRCLGPSYSTVAPLPSPLPLYASHLVPPVPTSFSTGLRHFQTPRSSFSDPFAMGSLFP